MAWTTPTIRATGYLVTASDWNTDIVDNLAYLKGEAGLDIEIEDDLVPAAGSEKIGKSTAPWDEGNFDKLFAGPRCAIHKFVREVVINFEHTDNLGGGSGGGGNQSLAGTGQYELHIDDDVNGSNAYICEKAEDANTKDTSFNVSRNPYGRFEFCNEDVKACQVAFIGFRRTPSGSVPPSNEVHAGLWLDNSTWFAGTGDGASSSTGAVAQPAEGARHVLEVLVVSATEVEFYIDGVLVRTMTVTLPTGDLEWTVLFFSEGTGGVGEHSYFTVGKIIAQEDLS